LQTIDTSSEDNADIAFDVAFRAACEDVTFSVSLIFKRKINDVPENYVQIDLVDLICSLAQICIDQLLTHSESTFFPNPSAV
jgi:hypothetical protein